MHKMTAANLRSAYGGESMAHMRYTRWGDRAEEEGFSNVARLFRAIASAEVVHATNHFNALKDVKGDHLCASMAVFGVGKSEENLAGAIAGETFEIEEMYPAYRAVAEMQDEKEAQRSIHYAISAEKIHAEMFKKARQAVAGGSDLELGPVGICSVCGYTVEGDIPEKCPICGAPREKFRSFPAQE